MTWTNLIVLNQLGFYNDLIECQSKATWQMNGSIGKVGAVQCNH